MRANSSKPLSLLKLATKNGFINTDSQPIWQLSHNMGSQTTSEYMGSQEWETTKARPEWLVNGYLQKETVKKQQGTYTVGGNVD
jgi:hypothetical protein